MQTKCCDRCGVKWPLERFELRKSGNRRATCYTCRTIVREKNRAERSPMTTRRPKAEVEAVAYCMARLAVIGERGLLVASL